MVQSNMQILILADESVEDSAIQADSRSLATLLLIRDIQVFMLEVDCRGIGCLYCSMWGTIYRGERPP
jgi:hypothetical protein